MMLVESPGDANVVAESNSIYRLRKSGCVGPRLRNPWVSSQALSLRREKPAIKQTQVYFMQEVL